MTGSRGLWIGLAASLLLLTLFISTVDVGRMLDAVADANYLYVAPAVGLYLASILFRTLRWRLLLVHIRRVSTRRLYPVVVVGYMANNLLPVRLGELVRGYYLGEREDVSKTSALATIFVERVLDALTLLFLIAAMALFVPLSGVATALEERSGVAWPVLAAAGTVPFVAAFVALLLAAAYPDWTRRAVATVLRPLPRRVAGPLTELWDYFLHGLMPLRRPKTLAVLLLLSLPVWLLEAGLFTLIGYSFGLQDLFGGLWSMVAAMILVTAISNIGSSVPAAPGGIGLFELVARETLVALPLAAVDRSVAGAFAAVVHASLLFPMILLGQVFLWTGHISLRRLSHGSRANDPVPAGEGDAQGSAVRGAPGRPDA